MKSGIYCIENLINGKKYIGQSNNLTRRINDSHAGCIALMNAINFYGKENFSKYIVLYCEPDDDELERYERACIKIFHSHVSENGYNISWGGNIDFAGRKISDNIKKKLSDKKLGENNPKFGKKTHQATSKYFGVYAGVNKILSWKVSLRSNNIKIYLGTFYKEIDAAKAYDEYIINHNLLHPLNFPEK